MSMTQLLGARGNWCIKEITWAIRQETNRALLPPIQILYDCNDLFDGVI
jgi:hypothetical protein